LKKTATLLISVILLVISFYGFSNNTINSPIDAIIVCNNCDFCTATIYLVNDGTSTRDSCNVDCLSSNCCTFSSPGAGSYHIEFKSGSYRCSGPSFSYNGSGVTNISVLCGDNCQ